jgi:flagellar biosynthesis/type III secretory pathway chaperone
MLPLIALKTTLDGLLRLLEQEKQSLINGELAAIPGYAKSKAELSARLDQILADPRAAAQTPAFRGLLKKVAQAASENEELINAAREGVKSARARLKEIIERQRMVGVYGEGGEKVLSHGAGVTRCKTA